MFLISEKKITRRQKAKGTKEEKAISVENIRSNFKVTLLKGDSNTGEYCRVFKITCFEGRPRTAGSIRCYFDTSNLK